MKFRSDSKLAAHVEEAARLYREGESTVTLAERYGVNKTTMFRFLQTLGVVMRTRSDAALLAFQRGRRKAKTGPDNHAWEGGRARHSKGYQLVQMWGHHLADCHGYVLEHRLVAERMIGRPLAIGEDVHHRNGDKTDNRPENLSVLTRNEHMALHVKKGDMTGLALGPYSQGRCQFWMGRMTGEGSENSDTDGHR